MKISARLLLGFYFLASSTMATSSPWDCLQDRIHYGLNLPYLTYGHYSWGLLFEAYTVDTDKAYPFIDDHQVITEIGNRIINAARGCVCVIYGGADWNPVDKYHAKGLCGHF